MKKILKNTYIITILVITILVIYIWKMLTPHKIIISIFFGLLPFLLAYIQTWILYPLYKKIKEILNGKLSILIVIFLILSIYLILVFTSYYIIKHNLKDIINFFNTTTIKITSSPYYKKVRPLINEAGKKILKNVSILPGIILQVLFSELIMMYMLPRYSLINSFIINIFPKKYRYDGKILLSKISINMRCYLKGILIDSVILLIMCFLIFMLFKIKYSFLFALFCSITNIIPFIGPYIGGAPVILVGFNSSTTMGVILTVVIVIIQTVESNIINPIIMSKCTKLSPLLIIFTISILSSIFGIWGFLLTLPILIIFKTIYDFYIDEYDK